MVASSLFACAPKRSGVTGRNNTANALTNNGNQYSVQNCGLSTGIVTGQNANFESDVKNFLSATINPDEVGQINAASSVKFMGTVKTDSAGNVISGSQLYFTITDSFAAQGGFDSYGNVYKPITLTFDQNSGAQFSGQINKQTGLMSINVRDSYGTLQLTGIVDAQSFSGTISYQNTQHILGNSPAGGTLGQFRVARCGFLQ